MTLEHIKELFTKHSDEYLRFENVHPLRRLHRRPDLCAFLKLESLFQFAQGDPGTGDMVSYAGHDEIGLAVSPEDIAGVVGEADIIDLIRCGVRFDGTAFLMFV